MLKTYTLNNGATVLGKATADGQVRPYTFANQTQALHRAQATLLPTGVVASVRRFASAPFYIVLTSQPAEKVGL